MHIKFVLILAVFFTSNANAFTLAMPASVKGWNIQPLEIHYSTKDCGLDILPALQDAISVWNTVNFSNLYLVLGKESDVSISQISSSSAANIITPIVMCHPKLSSLIGNSEYIPAVTQVSYSSLALQYGVIILNSEPETYANISKISAEKLRIVIAHELGHVLGLGHSANSTALMYYNASSKTQLALSQDEYDGIAYLYPRNDFGSEMFSCGSIQTPLNKKGPSSLFVTEHRYWYKYIISNFLMIGLAFAYALAGKLAYSNKT